ncbi:formate dehydrogenase accessory sulfurtransferase FdhD [Acetobacter sp.]|uniref:formate dehydrogenase accessory sulfurtransferase FdhD n=1 Tax=Acetobacter sp. TaxID=440 RepID=UPI0039E86D1E
MTEDIQLPISHSYDAELIRWSDTEIIREKRILTVAEEVPLSLVYGGIDYAIMMITPHDVNDFVTGFSLTEGIISSVSELRQITVTRTENGLKADILVGPEAMRKVLSRNRRPIAGRTGCGICGSDENSLLHNRPPMPLTGDEPSPTSLHRALENIRSHQVLNKDVGMLHAAAWCHPDGHIAHIREDVGRHNALDKLIGLGIRENLNFKQGFCLLTSRCSYEMVAKAVTAGISAVVALSSPTAFALRIARESGLVLVSPAHSLSFTVAVRSATLRTG